MGNHLLDNRRHEMIIGILKEIYKSEKRVVLRPFEVKKLVENRNIVYVERMAGTGVNFSDEAYEKAGAEIKTTNEIYNNSELLLKLRSPTEAEFKKIHNKILFSMLHLAQNQKRLEIIKKNKITAIEMESVKNEFMERHVDATDITGEIGVLYSTQFLNVMPDEANVLILGYGRVGTGALKMCNKLGIKVKLLKKAEYMHISHFIKGKDMLINAITWPVAEQINKNYIVDRSMLKNFNKGGVILDLSVDYPSPIETCRPTSLSQPWFIVNGITHICIYGYPSLVPLSSVNRYSKQILPLILEISKNNGMDSLEKKSSLGKDIVNAVVGKY
jgi:alanine dehydrogenase